MEEKKLIIALLIFGLVNFSIVCGGAIYLITKKVKARLRQNKVDHFGDSAEKKVISFLKKSFPKATIMDSVYLRTSTGLTELDILMICDRGLFIVEVKSHNGYIVTDGKFWTQHWHGKVVRFHSPIFQNNAHKAALESVFRKRQSLASLPVYTVAVFTSPNVSFSKNIKDVIKFSSLHSYIKRKKPDKRMKADMIKTVEKFVSTNMETSKIRQNKHRRQLFESNSKKHAYRMN